MLPPGKRRKVYNGKPRTRRSEMVTYRVQVRKCLCDINSQPILSVLVCGREQTNEVEVQCTGLNGIYVKSDREGIVAAWSITLGYNLECVFCPVVLDGFGCNLN